MEKPPADLPRPEPLRCGAGCLANQVLQPERIGEIQAEPIAHDHGAGRKRGGVRP